MIREAVPADRDAITRLLKDAHTAADMPFDFSQEHAVYLADKHTADPDYLALVATSDAGVTGVLLATSQPHPFAAIKYSFETVWWLAPSARGRAAFDMLDAYERWSREAGCAFAGMAALASFPGAGKIYERRGYKPTETHYLKTLV